MIIMTENTSDIRLLILKHALEKNHKIGKDVCVCSAGRSKCKGTPSLWSKGFQRKVVDAGIVKSNDEAYGFLRNNLFTQIDSLRTEEFITSKGRIITCIKGGEVDEVQKAVDADDISLIVEGEVKMKAVEDEVTTPTGEKIKVPFKKVPVKKERSPQWEVAFSENFWKGVNDIWKDTVDVNREHQMAVCLDGFDIIGGGKIVGNPESVEALDRDLICPDNTVKIGSIHTHPPDAQFLLEKRGLSKTDIEKTMLHSTPDLDVMIKFNDGMACVKSERSVTCLVNHSDYMPRDLFRDLVVGHAPYSRDKVKFVGEMEKRGIRKHRFVEDSILVDYPDKIKCGPEGKFMKCDATETARNSPKKEIKTKFQDIHTTGLDVSPKFNKKDMVMEYDISPYTNEQASCWIGFDGYTWCDGHDSMSKVSFSKEFLQPLYEKRIWEVLNKEIRVNLEISPLWRLMENYINILKTSPVDNDQKKARLLNGAMEEYEDSKDPNYFTKTVLSLISII